MEYELGLRVSEVTALKWDAIDFNSGTISIRRAYSREARQLEETTKSGRKRTLWMSDGVRASLLKIKNESIEYVLSNQNGKPLRYERLREAFKKHQLEAGITNLIGLHDLRHTFASHFVMRGGSIYDLKALLGHSDVGTTMRYAHLAEDHLREKSKIVQLKLTDKSNELPRARP